MYIIITYGTYNTTNKYKYSEIQGLKYHNSIQMNSMKME